MRLFAICALAAAVAAGGCNRAGAVTEAPGATAGIVGAAGTTGESAASAPITTMSREVTIPAGTPLTVVLDTPVGSDTSRVEESVQGHLSRPLALHGETVLPSGSRLSGVVTDATRSAKVKGRAYVAVRFDTLRPRGDDERYAIRTASVGRTAAATKEKDALEIGGAAAGGAIIGALVGGSKGALIGTGVGGGAGTGAVLATRGKEIHMPQGTALTMTLSQAVTVRVGQ
jgi:hypothetical protein